MPTTISDLWLLTYDKRPVDIRGPLYSSRQVEREVGRANAELRDGRSDWTSIELEEAIILDQERRCAVSPVRVVSTTSSAPLSVNRKSSEPVAISACSTESFSRSCQAREGLMHYVLLPLNFRTVRPHRLTLR